MRRRRFAAGAIGAVSGIALGAVPSWADVPTPRSRGWQAVPAPGSTPAAQLRRSYGASPPPGPDWPGPWVRRASPGLLRGEGWPCHVPGHRGTGRPAERGGGRPRPAGVALRQPGWRRPSAARGRAAMAMAGRRRSLAAVAHQAVRRLGEPAAAARRRARAPARGRAAVHLRRMSARSCAPPLECRRARRHLAGRGCRARRPGQDQDSVRPAAARHGSDRCRPAQRARWMYYGGDVVAAAPTVVLGPGWYAARRRRCARRSWARSWPTASVNRP